MSGHATRMRWLVVLGILLPAILVTLMLAPVWAQMSAANDAARAASPPEVMKWAFITAALASGLSALGAAYAVAVVGGAAMGAVAEKPDTAGRALVFVGLAEGIAIYGLIIAIMILGYLS